MSGWFGWGDDVLGDVDTTGYHSLNGSQFITKPSFHTSTSVQNLEAEGSMLHGSHTGPGDVVSDTTDYSVKSSLGAGGTWKPWGSTGFRSYSKSYLNHANVVEISWNKGDHPGYWWMYQKSLIADDPDGNNWYDFKSDTYKFTKSEAIGYHAE